MSLVETSMGGRYRGGMSGRPGIFLLLVLASSSWLTACPGLEVEFQKVGQDGGRRPLAPPTLAELPEFDLIARLPPREKQREGTGGWRLNGIAQEIARRAREGLLSDRAWVALLVRDEFIHTRPRWPTNVPLQIRIREPEWTGGTRVVIEAVDPPIGKIEPSGRRCGLAPKWPGSLGVLPAGTREVVFEVTIGPVSDRWAPYERSSSEPGCVWTGTLVISVEAVSSIDDCLDVASGPAVDTAIRESMSARFGQGSINPTWVQMTLDATKHPVLSGLGVSLTIEVLKDGDVVESQTLKTKSSSSRSLESVRRQIARDPVELTRWQVRIRGVPDGLLTLWEAERWWDGELTIPLAELIERGRLP